MTYPGGKGSHFQKLINLIPPHQVYIETHLGGGAIARAKRPAARNILIDLDPAAIAAFSEAIIDGGIVTTGDNSRIAAIPDPIAQNGDVVTHRQKWWGDHIATSGDARCTYELLNTDALDFLRAYPFQGDEFVYCDPPYLMSTRRQHRPIYRYELVEADHMALLACLKALSCKVMISGYWSQLYAEALASWHTASFQAITRGGNMATEWLWMNYPKPVRLHEYSFLGENFRERERIKRKKQRWIERLKRMDILERQALLIAIDTVPFD